MTTTELWFNDSSDEDERLVELARSKNKLRDALNPLERDSITRIYIKNFRLRKEAFTDLLSSTDDLLRQCGSLKQEYPWSCAAHRVCGASEELNILKNMLYQRWIKFNYTEEEMRQAIAYFYDKSGIPVIIGSIDGTYIKIVAPKKELQHEIKKSSLKLMFFSTKTKNNCKRLAFQTIIAYNYIYRQQNFVRQKNRCSTNISTAPPALNTNLKFDRTSNAARNKGHSLHTPLF